jgi:hypothetical protein
LGMEPLHNDRTQPHTGQQRQHCRATRLHVISPELC